MYLYTILAFAVLFWRAEDAGGWVLLGREQLGWILTVVFAQPPLFWLLAVLAARRSRKLLAAQPESPHVAQFFYHRTTMGLRAGLIAGLAGVVLLTDWPTLFDFGRVHPVLQIFGDLIVLAPFVLGLVATWVAAFPLEVALRSHPYSMVGPSGSGGESWSLKAYLDFNLRHQFLVVAVPMTLILFAADVIRGYDTQIERVSGWLWAPDFLLGTVAVGVFIVAPAMLIKVWRTAPLEPGPVRDQLEALCRRVRLRCRAILVWESDGLMINAAVMGIIPGIRYVLLSDALLDSMTPRQIEAVFAHEAGHIKKHHIQSFLLFAFVGWLLVAGLMELLARMSIGGSAISFSMGTIQGMGVFATFLFWGLGFGALSRRFERQADLFGARCVSPDAPHCHLPCSVHPDHESAREDPGRVCATGAALFASALERVALLNGIPQEEPSWRHSSIGSRIRFLTSMAGDPRRAIGFDRFLRRLRMMLLVLALVGAAGTVTYWRIVEEPAILKIEASGPPPRGV